MNMNAAATFGSALMSAIIDDAGRKALITKEQPARVEKTVARTMGKVQIGVNRDSKDTVTDVAVGATVKDSARMQEMSMQWRIGIGMNGGDGLKITHTRTIITTLLINISITLPIQH